MTWSEFMIRLHAFKRQERNEWYKIRELAWNSLIGSHVNPKKLPKTKESFMPLNLKRKVEISNLMKERIKQAQEQYIKDQQKNG